MAGLVWDMEVGVGVEEFKLFLGYVTPRCGIPETLCRSVSFWGGMVGEFLFYVVDVFCFWVLFIGLVGFGDFCCDHAGEVYLTEPLEW